MTALQPGFWGPSTVPLLLEKIMGFQTFYYLLADCPDEMDGLIRTMHQRELDAFAARVLHRLGRGGDR